jgi:uncharacterized membrane protein
MRFAFAPSWWFIVVLVAAIAALAWGTYARALAPLEKRRRAMLTLLRAATLTLLVLCLLRPVRVMPPLTGNDAVVPVLVDVSRSMRLADANGRARIDAARDLVRQIRPTLAGKFQSDVWTFGDVLARASGDTFTADAPRSDLAGALRAVRERYRERRVAGIVVLSDGGETGSEDAAQIMDDAAMPVYTIGVGTPHVGPDLEVLAVAAGEGSLTGSSVDLTVSAVNHRRTTPFDIRVLENGQSIDVRHVTPAAADSPVREVLTVSPSRETATVYTVEIPADPDETVTDNNRRSVIVNPPGRRRRLLFVEGAPGFEHSFIKRALVSDAGLELDSVVRKGRNEQGAPTYLVQAMAGRAQQLASGFPRDRDALFQYDAIVFANIEPDALSRAQLEMAADFVGERGGGLLVLGAKSFTQQGLIGTALEEVLPVDLHDRGSGVVRTAVRSGQAYRLVLTPDGEAHPVMRIAATPEQSARLWSAVPALAGATSLGAPRPGAQVLAVTNAPDGVRPLLAVQRYGRGRSMVFAGEASWRWRMQMPSTDRTHELFWRQVVRWLSGAAPDPVSLTALGPALPGVRGIIGVDVRNAAFEPVTDANVSIRLTLPGGEVRDLKPTLVDPKTGRYEVQARFDAPGVYRVGAQARRGDTSLGAADRWTLVGGADLEMADPRLNEDVLRRVSRASGGRYLSMDDLSHLSSLLKSGQADPGPPRLQELWHNVWIFTALVGLLAAEWVLRRQWGLR